MRKRLSPRQQALKDIRESGLSINLNFDVNIRKTNINDQENPGLSFGQLKMIQL